MPYVVGSVATLHKGTYVPGGKSFEVSAAEVEDFQSKGFSVVEMDDSAKMGSINMSPISDPGVIPENFAVEISESVGDSAKGSVKVLSGANSKPEKPMGGKNTKAKSVSKVSTKKEG